MLNPTLGSTGTFLLLVAINIGSWFFVRGFVPETKGATLEELEERFDAQDGRDVQAAAPA